MHAVWTARVCPGFLAWLNPIRAGLDFERAQGIPGKGNNLSQEAFRSERRGLEAWETEAPLLISPRASLQAGLWALLALLACIY